VSGGPRGRRFLFANGGEGDGPLLRASNPVEERVIALAEPVAAELGMRLVRVRLTGLKRKRLQIMAERAHDGGMGLEDCEALSHALSPLLEAEDPVPGEYDLEVSSPGIDRPLVRLEDFARFAGHEAKIETIGMIDGRRRYRGAILGVDGENVRIRVDADEFTLPIAQLSEARLVLTERLIQEDLKRAKASAQTQ
jgi:ribosome maturation factor RimP